MPEETTLAVGQIVYADDPRTPGPYRITNRGPKNWTITPVNIDGTSRPGQSARFPGWMLTPATPNGTTSLAPVGVPYEPRRDMSPGTIVRFAQDGHLYAVLADKVEKVNIARLGGDGGRYYRAPGRALTVIPLQDLMKELAVELAGITPPQKGSSND